MAGSRRYHGRFAPADRGVLPGQPQRLGRRFRKRIDRKPSKRSVRAPDMHRNDWFALRCFRYGVEDLVEIGDGRLGDHGEHGINLCGIQQNSQGPGHIGRLRRRPEIDRVLAGRCGRYRMFQSLPGRLWEVR